MRKEKWILGGIFLFIVGILVWVKLFSPTDQDIIVAEHGPSLNTLSSEKNADQIKKGRDYINHTSSLLPNNVGSTMSCASCHATGATGGSLDLVGVTKEYPQYNKRAGKVVSIEERVNGCFTRSMNGKKLDPNGKEMKAIISYLNFLSKDTADDIKDRPWTEVAIQGDLPKPNIENGKDIYSNSCMACHGSTQASSHGLAVYGKNSYNDGAGMNRLRTTAGFIQHYMPKEPMGGVETGGLTKQQAVDVAAYINSVGRPVMKGKEKDYPHGDPPDDLSYPVDSVHKK